jgi:solute carrier family 13 (sodium-dependent dicarboxylate transporter), member 2/3/5
MADPAKDTRGADEAAEIGTPFERFSRSALGRVVAQPVLWAEGTVRALRHRTVLAALAVGAGLAVAIGGRFGWLLPPEGLSREGLVVGGVVVAMAALWLFEVLPIAATALLPMVLFPALGVQPAAAVANAYGNSTILLLLGSFMLARGVERWQVPNLLASRVTRWAAGSPTRLVAGLMFSTAVLSAWISNTAATLIMVTVGLAAVRRAEALEPARTAGVERFRVATLLGIAFSANIGGLLTPIGSPPNVIMLALYRELVPGAQPVSFLSWIVATAPIVVAGVALVFLLLTKVALRFPRDLRIGEGDEGPAPGLASLGPGGRRALAVFALTALGWVFRADVDLGVVRLPGWESLLGLRGLVDDATVAIGGLTLLFLLPAGSVDDARRAVAEQAPAPDEPPWVVRVVRTTFRKRLLTWDEAREIPWYLLLLFGGGLALASAFDATGLGAWLGGRLAGLEGAPPWLVVLAVSFAMSLVTEVTSNTASTAIFVPVLAAASPSLGVPALELMWPAALCASAAFLMPIGTPPNAIAAGAGNLSFAQMARAGLLVKLAVVPMIAAVMRWWMPLVVGSGP